MDFWTDHSVMYIIGLVVIPRLMLVYMGLIPPGQVPPILGFMLVPRMFLASLLTTTYGHTNPALIVVCWILAIVFDLIGIVFKFAMMGKTQAEMNAFMLKMQQ